MPCAITRPRSMTGISSANASASSGYCVVSSTVAPSATSARTTFQMSSGLAGASLVVGSSRWITSSPPTATRPASGRSSVARTRTAVVLPYRLTSPSASKAYSTSFPFHAVRGEQSGMDMSTGVQTRVSAHVIACVKTRPDDMSGVHGRSHAFRAVPGRSACTDRTAQRSASRSGTRAFGSTQGFPESSWAPGEPRSAVPRSGDGPCPTRPPAVDLSGFDLHRRRNSR